MFSVPTWSTTAMQLPRSERSWPHSLYNSGFLPRILGVLLVIDFGGEMICFQQFFFLLGYDVITYPDFAAGLVAEVSLNLWLLIVGVREQKPALRVRPSASSAANS